MVHQRDLAAADYPRYFANLIVSARSATGEKDLVTAKIRERLQRPFGGVVCVGANGKMQVDTRGPL